MELLCPAIGFLVIAVGLVTVIGHGLWIFFAGLFGASRSDKSSPPVPTIHLPTTASPMQNLGITRDEVLRLQRVGRIDDATCRNMLTAIKAEQTRLMTFGTVTNAPPHTPAVAPIHPPTTSGVAPAQPEPAPAERPFVAFDDRWCQPEASPSTSEPKRGTGFQAASIAPPEAPAGPATKPTAEASPLLAPIPSAEPLPSQPPAPPPPPRKPFAKMFAAFMEEKNIRWGELVGGMLIVLCSTALVVSLWSQIAAIPVLKFFVFTAVTASLFGAGLYTEHRWKLPTTSRGLLITASLLVPLTFLAISAFSEAGGTRESLALPAELIALGLFAALLVWSGRVIAPHWSLLIVIGVMGSSAGQLAIRRVASPDCTTLTLFVLAALPLLCYCGAVGWMASRAARWPEIDRPNANAIFSLLGILAFAAVVPFGLLLHKTGAVAETLQRLALAVTVFGLPGITSGLLFWQKTKQEGMAPIRVAGTSIGVAGVIVLLAGMVLAWPQPARLLPISILDFLALASLALLFEIPAAHLPAGLCLTIAYLLGFHLVGERVVWLSNSATELVRAVLSATSGTGLVPLVAVLVATATWLTKRGKHPHGAMYAVVSGLVAAFSLGLVSCYGLGHADDHGATWVYAIYAAGAFVVAGVVNQSMATWLGSGLLLLALVQGTVYRFGPGRHLGDAPQAWQLAFMLHATIATIGAPVREPRRNAMECRFPEALRRSIATIRADRLGSRDHASAARPVHRHMRRHVRSSVLADRDMVTAGLGLGIESAVRRVPDDTLAGGPPRDHSSSLWTTLVHRRTAPAVGSAQSAEDGHLAGRAGPDMDRDADCFGALCVRQRLPAQMARPSHVPALQVPIHDRSPGDRGISRTPGRPGSLRPRPRPGRGVAAGSVGRRLAS